MSQRSEPKTHAASSVMGALCGSRSMAAQWRTAECTRCQRRVDELIELLATAAAGVNVQKQAAALMRKWGLRATPEEGGAT